MSDAIRDIARNVALARADEDRLKAIVKEADEAHAQQTAYMREQLKAASDAARQAEFNLRIEALRMWEQDGNKQQPGVTIRMVKRLLYAPQDALDYAIEHKMFLKLNETAFERYAKASPPAFVMVNEEPTAAIDSDLSEFVK